MSLPKILITNGGPHPASAWAELTADELVVVGGNADGVALKAAIVAELTKQHAAIQGLERDGKVYDKAVAVDRAVKAVIKIGKASSFADHFARDDVRARMGEVIDKHFSHSIQVERDWNKRN